MSRTGHAHDHAHGHGRAPASYGFAFALATGLNVAFVVVEAVFGVLANSTALVADAGHNLSDVLGLVVAWGAAVLSRRAPSGRYTYGLRGSSILAALFNAVFLLVAVGAIAWEAVHRMLAPQPVAGITVMVVAGIGIAINGATAALFASGRSRDINIEGAFLHMAADAAVSAGVVIGGGMILLTGWLWIDPALSLAICLVIVGSTWSLLRDAVKMSLAAVPAGIDADAVRAFLAQRPGVAALHDLHIWPMSTTESALTCHLVMPGGHPGDGFLAETAQGLAHRFGIGHATLQIELGPAACALAPDHVV
ncbi:MAG: cation diffusion facilitator family transporter [Xanthobacteraceae bacterium]|nr:cation diffusion facilitator family transporter [Xanthobacteraceae bacterium]